MTKHSLFILFLTLFYLSACTNEGNIPTVTSTAVAKTQLAVVIAATPTPPSTPTILPTPTSPPTSTPIPYVTMPPFPTVTPIGVYPVKQILMQVGTGGGDGGDVLDSYFGRNTPQLVIYTDGQIIIQGYPTTLSGQLPTDELCSLLAKLETIGYFDPVPDDMIYVFDDTTQFSDGAGYYDIQVNGPLNNRVGIYGPYWDYVPAP